MRKCPYCARDIQDEAVVCRYCKLDVPLPAHLIGKLRCPHCAEWIPNSAPICPFCGRIPSRARTGPQLPKADTPAPPKPDWLRRLEPPPLDEDAEKAQGAEAATGEDRGWPFSGKRAVYLQDASSEAKPTEALPDWLVGDEDRAQVSQRLSEATSSEPREQAPRPKKEPPLEPAPAESQSEYGDLRLATYSAEPVSQPVEPAPSCLQRIMSAARSVAFVTLAVGLVAAIIWLVRPYLFGGQAPPLTELATPTVGAARATELAPTATAPAALPTAIPEASPAPATPTPGMTQPSPTSPQEACLTWDQVKAEDQGKEICVTGTIKRWFSTSAVPLVIVFSEEEGSFYLIDRVQNYPEAVQGACVRAQGVVELWSGVRPVLDAHGALTFCSP